METPKVLEQPLPHSVKFLKFQMGKVIVVLVISNVAGVVVLVAGVWM